MHQGNLSTESDKENFKTRMLPEIKGAFYNDKGANLPERKNSSTSVFIQQHSFKTSIDSLAISERLTFGEKKSAKIKEKLIVL